VAASGGGLGRRMGDRNGGRSGEFMRWVEQASSGGEREREMMKRGRGGWWQQSSR